jgi:hypothetical protein
MKVDDEAHLHPQAIKHKEKKRKKKELDFLSRLGDGDHPILEATKQKEKNGASL